MGFRGSFVYKVYGLAYFRIVCIFVSRIGFLELEFGLDFRFCGVVYFGLKWGGGRIVVAGL